MKYNVDKKLAKELTKQLHREALAIEAVVNNNLDVADVEVPMDMHALVMHKIKTYESENRSFKELSEEDREALAIGREIRKQRMQNNQPPLEEQSEQSEGGEIRRTTYRRKRKKTKLWFVLAAVLVLVLGIGATSIGSKQYILDVVNKVLGNDEVVVVNTNKSDRKYTETAEENAAYQEIYQEFGFHPPQFQYLPKGIVYSSCNLKIDISQATIEYLYHDKNFLSYHITSKSMNSSSSIHFDDELMEAYHTKVGGFDIIIENRKVAESKDRMYVAKFSDEYAFYCISGVLEKDKFEKIIQDLIFY